MIDFSRTLQNVVIDKDAELILQQIDILLDTDKGEVLGDYSFGSDYDKFLYELNVSGAYIEQYVYNHITTNVDLFDWNLEVEVQILAGELNDIILLGIEVYKNNDSYTKVYKIDTLVHEPDNII